MAPHYLPRVNAFPILTENSRLLAAGASAELPITERKESPLVDHYAPEINLPDHLGRRCSLHATMALGRPIIIFFFPLAGSPHCTKESCLFRDAIGLTPIFSDLQAIVIGISQDPPERSKRFADEHQLGYRILHDENRKAMEDYGVSRTMFGLLDNRSTFVIDPSGIIRGVVDGVLNSTGHLKFAEKWLIRLEHELSERSRKFMEHASEDADLIAGPDAERERMIKVVYGDRGSAQSGGIGGVPRYGAQSMAQPKPLPGKPQQQRRPPAFDEDSWSTSTFKEERAVEKGGKGGKRTELPREKNIWKSWKSVLSQLSSPDGLPPPAVVSERGRSMESMAGTKMQKAELQDGQSTSPAGSTHSKKSTWSSRSNPTRTLSRRSKSTFGTKKPVRLQDSQVPPVPQLMPANVSNGERIRNDSTDVDSEKDGLTNWGTDVSLESNLSTAPSSLGGHSRMRTGSQSSKAGPSGASNPSMGQLPSQAHLSKPSVTSEVLMPEYGGGGSRDSSTRAPPLLSHSAQPIPPQAFQQLRIDSITPTQRSHAPLDVPEDAKPEEEEVVTLSPPTAAVPSAYTSPRTGRRPGSSDSLASSRPTSATGRRTKRVPPPVVSAYHPNLSWDSAYVKSDGHDPLVLSSDSDRTVRPNGQHVVPTYSPMHHKRSQSNQSQSSADSSTYDVPPSRTSLDLDSRLRPFSHSSPRNVNTPTRHDSQRTPTSSNAGQASNSWVLQSLHSPNGVERSPSGQSKAASLRGNSPVLRGSQDESRARTIPRKAPPPMYAPPPPPKDSASSSTHGSDRDRPPQAALFSGLPASHSHSSVASSYDGHAHHDGFLPTSRSASRRPSLSDSLHSVGTFG